MRNFTSLFFLILCLGWATTSFGQTVIASQDFNALAPVTTGFAEQVANNGTLTNAATQNNGGGGLNFSTNWQDTRAIGTGPSTNGIETDFIGINSFAGSGAPDVGPGGTPVAAGVEQNFQFNDCDGRCGVEFEVIDLSGFSNRAFSFKYWIRDTGYEDQDALRAILWDGSNLEGLITLPVDDLEANASADDGTDNWQMFMVDLEPIFAGGFDASNLMLTIQGDLSANDESIFIDDVKFTADNAPSGCTELFISEYVEGGGFSKCIEIYNPTESTIDLAAEGYSIFVSFNGGSSTSNFALTGSIASGDVYVFCDDGSDAALLAESDQETTSSLWSGDDAIALRKNGENVDVIGQIGFDPGTQWGSGFTSTRDNTLRRKAGINSGDPDGSDVFDPSVEWDGLANNTFDGIGSHTFDGCDGGVDPPEPTCNLVINEVDYDQPVSDDKEFIELYNPCEEAISLNGYTVRLINGSNNTTYRTIILPNVSLAPGEYFVICSDGSSVENCDFNVAGVFTNLIQNGSPDAIALFEGIALADALSYEGDVAGSVEGSGSTGDSGSLFGTSLSRNPNGADTDNNNNDFKLRCSTPGAANETSGDVSACIPCQILDIELSEFTFCDDQGTGTNSDDVILADVTVTYEAAPSSGKLKLSGSGTAEVDVDVIGARSYTFIDVEFPSGGAAISLTATFDSANEPCTLSESDLGNTPDPCSLPLGWEVGGIGNTDECDVDYDFDNELWQISTDAASSDKRFDEFCFVYERLCGDGEIIARVNSIFGAPGIAGVTMRAGRARIGRFASMLTDLSPIVRGRFRSWFFGSYIDRPATRPGHTWVRLVRQGYNFIGYSSSDGVNWEFVYSRPIRMPDCLDVGILAHTTNGGGVTNAVFSDVELISGSSTAIVQYTDPNALNTLNGTSNNNEFGQLDMAVWPNPAVDKLEIGFSQPIEDVAATYAITDINGKLIAGDRVGEGTFNLEVDLDALNLSQGVYFISVKTGSEVITKRFIKAGR